ncbi:hypothetical protein [Streptomyces sp. E2N166]|uniref:hypothetical protein n=1 Tax=Streptomyces sp. E2N166 TaxID=1851909 RepID=UPI000EF6D38C|nr:hypothetical protein [Streptomyces sp. E2N166]
MAARSAARGIRIVDTPVQKVVDNEDGSLAGAHLAAALAAAQATPAPSDVRRGTGCRTPPRRAAACSPPTPFTQRPVPQEQARQALADALKL